MNHPKPYVTAKKRCPEYAEMSGIKSVAFISFFLFTVYLLIWDTAAPLIQSPGPGWGDRTFFFFFCTMTFFAAGEFFFFEKQW